MVQNNVENFVLYACRTAQMGMAVPHPFLLGKIIQENG